MQSIQNDKLKITVDEKGAELKSIFQHQRKQEYMWSGNPAYWAKTSPVLFPIVGTLKDNTYFYKGKAYQLSRHGFARDKVFAITEKNGHSLALSLASDEATKAVYPFDFVLSLIYTLKDETLQVEYRIENTGAERLFFSIGGHPAFAVPLVSGTAYNDYVLEFEKIETLQRWPISKEGLIETVPQALLNESNALPLSKELFAKDAIVLKHLKSSWVRLTSGKTESGLTFSFEGFPYLGLWAAPGADFLCIEPWQGIADSVDTNQQLENKEGIVELAAGESFRRYWSVEVF